MHQTLLKAKGDELKAYVKNELKFRIKPYYTSNSEF